jgi:hypothetical protein
MRWTLLTPLLLFVVPALHAQPVSDAEKKEGFVSLFDGKDFSGWRFAEGSALPEKLPDNWKVEDSVIKLAGGALPHCASQWDYEDFDLRLEWRAMKDNYNSGLYIRSGRKVGANQINLKKGGEGGIVGGKIDGAKTVPELQKPFTEWNDWRVLAVGDKVTFWCNGKLAWEGSGLQALRGYVGLQAEGAPIEFRNLRIRELGYEPLTDLAKWTTGGDHWKPDGDALVYDGKGGPLDSMKKDYKDYVLRLEWKGDTGAVALRGAASEKAVVQLGGAGGAGGLLGYDKKAGNPPGQWNYLELRVVGGKAAVWLNGVVVVDGADLKKDAGFPEKGGIRIKADGPMQIRNVRIKEVK